MNVGRLGRGELVAAAGGLLLVVCLFLPWYETSPDNANAMIDGTRGALSGWEVHGVLRWLLLAAAAAPLILIWIIVRDHELSWSRGEMTAVAAIAAFGLLAYTGLLDRPGSPSGAIALQPGFFGALAGTVLMIAGGAMRAAESETARRPPGVLR
ncbi:MAG: hypothetical protein ACRDPC_18495 [Solirubrobacteraceae bacterium]